MEVIDTPVAIDWTRLATDECHHGEMGGVNIIMRSSPAAHQLSYPTTKPAKQRISVGAGLNQLIDEPGDVYLIDLSGHWQW